MKVVLCAILRTENRYLADWLDYHLNLGFDQILNMTPNKWNKSYMDLLEI